MTLLLNAQADALQPGDLAALRDVADGYLWIYGRATEAATRQAMAQLPGKVHVARPYPEPWLPIDLSGFAAICLGNEPQAPSEADGWTDPGKYVAWKLALLQGIKATHPDVLAISPPLSPGVSGWADDLEHLRPLVQMCDVVGIHRYAGVDTLPEYQRRFPGRRYWVTEQGWPAPGDPLWLAGDAEVIALWAARWLGHAADGWDVLARPGVLERLRALRAAAATAQDAPARAQDGPGTAGSTPHTQVTGSKQNMTDYAKATWIPSPNFWSGRQGQKVTAIVLHGTAGPGAVSWFQNPASQVSAHYVVEEEGRVVQCVAEDDAAWHAGVVTPDSAYYGGPNCNLFTIGVEHTRDTGNTSPITDAQLGASLALVADICRRRGPLAIILHNQIDVGRVCPGPDFPLQRWLDVVHPPQTPADPTEGEAWSYYSQLGHTIDRSHSIWSKALLPLWRDYRAAPPELADLRKPGPLASQEMGGTWGPDKRPAGVVRLTNRIVGVYLGADGAWRPYQAEL